MYQQFFLCFTNPWDPGAILGGEVRVWETFLNKITYLPFLLCRYSHWWDKSNSGEQCWFLGRNPGNGTSLASKSLCSSLLRSCRKQSEYSFYLRMFLMKQWFHYCFIKSWLFFNIPCNKLGSTRKVLLLRTQEQWLSSGKVLVQFFESWSSRFLKGKII